MLGDGGTQKKDPLLLQAQGAFLSVVERKNNALTVHPKILLDPQTVFRNSG